MGWVVTYLDIHLESMSACYFENVLATAIQIPGSLYFASLLSEIVVYLSKRKKVFVSK